MTLLEQIDKAIKEVDLQLERKRAIYQAERDALQEKKAALQGAKRIVTPDLDAALVALERAGIQIRS